MKLLHAAGLIVCTCGLSGCTSKRTITLKASPPAPAVQAYLAQHPELGRPLQANSLPAWGRNRSREQVTFSSGRTVIFEISADKVVSMREVQAGSSTETGTPPQ
jgi:hypothetical protein